MIKKRTVFVLGAGASIPYGFPSGEKLFEIICKTLKNRVATNTRYLLEVGYDITDVTQFRDALFYSGKTSVDEFLEHRREFLEIGKCAIAMSLIPFEDENELFSVEHSKHWYKELYKQMNTLPDEILKNNIAFITFNYDRTLEHFLFTALTKSYNLTVEECSDILRDMKILHVHGTLGNHPHENIEIYNYFFNYKNNQKDLGF